MPSNPYKLIATKSFIKDLDNLPPQILKLLPEIEEQLITNPRQGKKLTNKKFGQWRIRIGDYRLRYDIAGDEIVLVMIRHRKDVYKK